MIGYQDETAICLCPPKGSTYSLKGRTLVLTVSDTKRYAHLSVCAYITQEGDLSYEVRQSSFNGRAIVRFLTKVFTGRKKRRHLVIWDGAAIHKCRAVKDFLKIESQKQSRIWLELLPPYIPELNPTELLWAYLKLSNMASKTMDELKAKVIVALDEIKNNRELIKSFFRHPKVRFMYS